MQAELAEVNGHIEVLLVSRESMEQQGGRARSVASGAVEAAEELNTSGEDKGGLQARSAHVRSQLKRR
jgi:hypothetical protein